MSTTTTKVRSGGFHDLIRQAKVDKDRADKELENLRLEKERREKERRKKQEEDERRDREIQAKVRQRHFEQQKREEALKKKREAEEKAAKQRREQEEASRAATGGKKFPGAKRGRDSDDEAPGGNFLTREEKRRRKQEAMFRTSGTKRAASAGKGYGKTGRSLPGGAVNVLASSSSSSSASGSGGSIRDRLMHAPNGLIKLNTVKRDTRTIDEIVQDLHQKKTLEGDQAKTFDDWFGDGKKKSAVPSTTPTPSKTGTSTPIAAPAPKKPSPPSSHPSSRPSSTKPRPPPLKNLPEHKSKPSHAAPSSGLSRKRNRSLSRSESPPPSHRDGASDIQKMVWEAMGYSAKSYSNADLFSDDEDMEADGLDVLAEEHYSSNVARREDAEALAEERRHDEAKKRRRLAKARGE